MHLELPAKLPLPHADAWLGGLDTPVDRGLRWGRQLWRQPRQRETGDDYLDGGDGDDVFVFNLLPRRMEA